MSTSRPLAIAAVALLGVGLLLGGARAELSFHHSTPLAGEDLVLVIDGAEPFERVFVAWEDPAVARALILRAFTGEQPPAGFEAYDFVAGRLVTWWIADAEGVVVLRLPLDASGDVGLRVDVLAGRLDASEPELRLLLMVHPPTLLVPGPLGIERIDLSTGTRLLPPILGDDELLGAALSRTGRFGYLLRDAGRLEVRDAGAWNTRLDERFVSADASRLGGGTAGVVYALATPSGEPFAPAGGLEALAETSTGRLSDAHDVALEPMAEAVLGRRAALTDDGRTLFVAEDDLLVREIDLLTGTARPPFAVGLAGDRAIADLVLDGDRLLVATRRGDGRSGALTVYDRRTGVVSPIPLGDDEVGVDPARLVRLGPDVALAVPFGDGPVGRIENGLLVELIDLPAAPDGARGRCVDAAALGGGAAALLLAHGTDHALVGLDAVGRLDEDVTPCPPADRLVGAGGAVLVLLGDPSGLVHAFDVETRRVRVIDGVLARPGAPHAIVP